MTVRPDPDAFIQAWLRDEAVERAPERLLTASRAQITSTRQRRSWWLAPRVARFAIAAAAVLVVAIVAIDLLPGNGGVGGPAVNPTTAPSETLATPSPSPGAFAFPTAGDLAIGSRHAVTTNGVKYSFTVPTSGWTSEGVSSIIKGTEGSADSTWMLFWSPANVYADPCAQTPQIPPAGPAAADLATAISTVHGSDVTGPLDVTVGGRAAKSLVLTLPAALDCVPEDFYLWYGEGDGDQCVGTGACGRFATAPGDTIRVWIVDVDGTRIFIEAEMRNGAGPELEQEIQQIVDSIRFE